MRIGLVSADFYPNVGGVAAHVVELGRALAIAGHDVHVISLPIADQRQPKSPLHGMTVHRPAIPQVKPLFTWWMHGYLRSLLRTTPLDLLHVHGMRPLEATRNLGVPVIFTNHTSGFLKRVEKGPAEHRRALKRLEHVEHVLAPSGELVEATQTVGYRGPVTFIPNGVDVERFVPGKPAKDFPWSKTNGEVVILLARRLVEKNGVRVFAEAIARLKGRPIRVVFAGDGPERPAVTRILSDADMLERCIFLGNVPNPEMPDIYRSADVSVLPSFMEATSITGLESMACGLPLVGTRVGGIPTLIDQGKTGWLVPPGNAVALAEAIDQLVKNADLRQAAGQAARQRAVENFSWAEIAARTADVYRQRMQKAA